ncbi:Uu.00g062360.m01.CDS01 [Anthostomella pinea]|uniref:Uu.00g062360.m01.CDS01 n=1 Tax=Anthostomella pinea TaxID=933095 RepID=A0AAI8YN09_9PEZI|nr:Uu.00g062360.m01.CDS01 [Anthostomella pinea]
MVEFVDINGARLAYQIRGPDDSPLFITLHGGRGFGDYRSDFKAYGPLGDRYRVLSFDFRGHGESSPTKPYTFEQIVDDIEAIRNHFAGEEKAIICGGSFGGFLAQHYAIKYSQHVSYLILRGTAPSYHQEEDAIKVLEQRIAKAPSFSVEMLTDKVFGAFESDLEFRLVHLAMSPLYSESFDANATLKSVLGNTYNAESHNDLYSEQEKYFDYRDKLHQITAKTLVVVGAKDWICPPEHSEYIASNIPSATLYVVENANHSVHLEKNEQVLSKIREHLSS